MSEQPIPPPSAPQTKQEGIKESTERDSISVSLARLSVWTMDLFSSAFIYNRKQVIMWKDREGA